MNRNPLVFNSTKFDPRFDYQHYVPSLDTSGIGDKFFPGVDGIIGIWSFQSKIAYEHHHESIFIEPLKIAVKTSKLKI